MHIDTLHRWNNQQQMYETQTHTLTLSLSHTHTHQLTTWSLREKTQQKIWQSGDFEVPQFYFGSRHKMQQEIQEQKFNERKKWIKLTLYSCTAATDWRGYSDLYLLWHVLLRRGENTVGRWRYDLGHEEKDVTVSTGALKSYRCIGMLTTQGHCTAKILNKSNISHHWEERQVTLR